MSPEESAPPQPQSAPLARDRSTAVVWVVLTMIAAALLLLVWRAQNRRGEAEGVQHPAVGQPLAFAQLEPLTGGAPPISAEQLQGKVTLLNFWGPWCEICLREMPHLVALHEKLADHSDMQFLFVSCGPDWEPNWPPARGWNENLPQLRSSTAALLAERGYDVATLSDPRGKTRQAFVGLDGWEGYPTTLLLDRDGVIRYVAIGYASGDEYAIEEQLRKLLESPPGGEPGT